jgi:hypothetical protein
MFSPRLPRLVAVVALATVSVATGVGCGGTKDDRPAQWSFISPTIIEPACATVNCHSAITHQGGVNLSNSTIGFQTLVGSPFQMNGDAGLSGQGMSYYVYPYYPQYSSLITLLNAVGSIRMPPDNPLPQADIQLISDWIQQGAENN